MTGRAVLAVLQRELVKMLRQRTRLLAAMVRPLIWLLVIGGGFGAVLTADGLPYQQFLAPGVVGMTMLFAAMLSALTMVYDKASGVMRMLVSAPFPHFGIEMAKAAAAVAAALVQALMLLVLLAALGFLDWHNVSWLMLVAALLTVSAACAAMGMLTAAFTRTLDNFAAVMNFVIFPVFFLSGSLYPITRLPAWLKAVAMANPYTYGVDLLKHALLGGMGGSFAAEFPAAVDAVVLVSFTLAALAVACARFSGESAFQPVIRQITGRRR
ncbi:MAG: ABC transporter permease [Betaproteobacteria bacterium]